MIWAGEGGSKLDGRARARAPLISLIQPGGSYCCYASRRGAKGKGKARGSAAASSTSAPNMCGGSGVAGGSVASLLWASPGEQQQDGGLEDRVMGAFSCLNSFSLFGGGCGGGAAAGSTATFGGIGGAAGLPGSQPGQQPNTSAGDGQPTKAPRRSGGGGGGNKVGGGKSLKGGGTIIGRPTEDPRPKLNVFLREIAASTNQSEKLFGPGWKSHKVNVDRWLKDIRAALEEEEDEDELKKLTTVKKQAEACRAVCNAYVSKGFSTKEFLAVYNEQLHFLKMDPVAPIPFPFFVRDNMVTVACSQAWPAQFFWELLTFSKLSQDVSMADVPIRQIQLCKDQGKHSESGGRSETGTGFM